MSYLRSSHSIRASVWLGLIALLLLPLAAPIGIKAQGDVLLEEKFENNSKGWQLSETTQARMSIGKGKLTININKENASRWVTPEQKLPSDVSIKVDLRVPQVSGSTGKWFAGLFVRANARDTSTAFLQFNINSEGQWEYVTRTDGGKEYKTQKSGTIKNFDVNDTFTLQAVSSGTDLTFSVNGTEVGTFSEKTINAKGGQLYAGMVAETGQGTDSAAFEFTNLVISGGDGQVQNAGGDNTGKAPSLGSVILNEDFSDKNPNGWPIKRTDKSDVTIKDNALNITVFKGAKDGVLRWVAPAVDFPKDVDITVTVAPDEAELAGKWTYGIGLRNYSQGESDYNYYLFEVTSDGKWMFSRYAAGGKWTTLVKETAIKNFKVDQSAKLNVIASGDKFEFYVNNSKVGEATDSTFPAQKNYRVMLSAATFNDTSSVAVAFTDLVVTKP